jgi:hypothetical protein
MPPPTQSLFRFVAVRRPTAPTPTQPPPPEVVEQVCDFSNALLPRAAQLIELRDRHGAELLLASLTGKTPETLAAGAALLRRLHRRAVLDDRLSLRDVRSAMADALPDSVLSDVAKRATTVVVLVRWLGSATSPAVARAASLLRGAVIARLGKAALADEYLVADLVRGHSIRLPELPGPTPDGAQANGKAAVELRALIGDLRRLGGRAAAVGLGADPPLAALRNGALGNLQPLAERVAAAAERFGLPPRASVSTLARVADLELASITATDVDVVAGGTSPPPVSLPPPSLPVLAARARILGRGDLMVVRVAHLRYELGEIAYIENVLRSELRGRTHVIDTATSEKIIETSELFNEAIQELTTTERFEFQEAASTANSSTTTLSAGMSVSGGFGPVTVGVEVSAGHSTSTSASNSSSTTYAKDVTDRATETMRSEASKRTETTNRTRITETNKHDFDNRTGDDHVRGIYRWLNKVDTVQVFNYGERLHLEFVVSEPAAQLTYFTAAAGGSEPTEPLPLDFGPADITEQNFVALGQRYDAAGLSRPPAMQVAVPATFTFAPANPSAEVNPDPDSSEPTMQASTVTTAEVSIPAGYAAGTVVTSVAYGGDLSAGSHPGIGSGLPTEVLAQATVEISLGGQRFAVWAGHSEESHVIELQERRTGNLPVAIGSKQVEGLAIAMRVIAFRTQEAYQAWQHNTFERIQQAYLAKRSEYQTAQSLAARRQAYTADTPPEINRDIEVRELTRGCQTVLTGQDFDLFGSVLHEPGDAPRIDVDEAWAEADAIVFFSDVIDWALMAYIYYPYQWAGRHRWAELTARTSTDPLHQAFLQAGAARVVVPVRDGYEHAVAKYLRTGEIPHWGPEPWRGRPTKHPTVDELIADANDRPDDGEVAVGDPWEVTSPTTLVYLQQDAELNPVPS